MLPSPRLQASVHRRDPIICLHARCKITQCLVAFWASPGALLVLKVFQRLLTRPETCHSPHQKTRPHSSPLSFEISSSFFSVNLTELMCSSPLRTSFMFLFSLYLGFARVPAPFGRLAEFSGCGQTLGSTSSKDLHELCYALELNGITALFASNDVQSFEDARYEDSFGP